MLKVLNTHPFKKLAGSRRSHFEAIDRPALRPLPARAYAFAEWHKARVAPNIHSEVDGHYYSVSHTLVKCQLDVRLSAATMEVFHHGQRVAAYPRSQRRGGYTTVKEHMPEAHRRYLDWIPERLLRWAQQIGPATAAAVEHLLSAHTHPQQGMKGKVNVNDDAGLEREADLMGTKALQMRLPEKSAFELRFHQGRMQPTVQAHGVNINYSPGLKREADVMGQQALQRRSKAKPALLKATPGEAPIQRELSRPQIVALLERKRDPVRI